MKRFTFSTPLSRPHGRTATLTALALATALALGSCGRSNVQGAGTSAGPAGAAVPHPDTGLRSQLFIVDSNRRGQAGEVKIVGLFWGRLVDVLDETGAVQQVDFVVGEDIRTDSVYEVSTNPVTEKTTVRIRHLANTPPYIQALKALGANLTPVQDKSLSPSELPPYSVAPRNSALVVIFDDLLDPGYKSGWRDSFGGSLVNVNSGQLNKQVVRILTDYPPNEPFEGRIIVDPNHGDLADFDGDGVSEFHSTRVILDLTVTVVQSADSDPPLPVNTIGLPKAITTQDPNVVVRIPTRVDPSVGQTQILTNPSKNGVAFFSNGSRDNDSVTRDIVRAFRSGGDSEITGDLNNGFLLDEEKPRLMGTMSVQLLGTPTADPEVQDGYIIPITQFDVLLCATMPGPGDVLVQGSTRALITGFDVQDGALITNLRAQVLTPIGGVLLPGLAQLITPFDPFSDNPACFARFSPGASVPPNAGVSSKDFRVFLRFSEPMDPSTLAPFDTFTVTRIDSDPTAFDFVVGNVVPSPDLREFSFAPVIDLAHTTGVAEVYYVNLASGPNGPTDLAGNPLEFALPQIPFALDPSESTEDNRGFVLRFHSNDELFDDGFPEVRTGQVLFDLQRQLIRPRPVNRFSIAADDDKPVPAAMTPFPPGVQTPLSSMGSKMQTVWRYCDLGFSASDETNINVDVEGMAWAPVSGQLVSDQYDEFSIRLAHSAFLPDEILDPISGFPVYPESGLKKTYNNNFLTGTGVSETFRIVHPRERGYVVHPSDLFTAESGKLMVPWPVNRGVPMEQFRYYTWRDTRILAKWGVASAGVPLAQEVSVLGLPTPAGGIYPPGAVRTVGLPLLMEFRCYPDNSALGLNPFEIALGANSSIRPNFRAFSTGGHDTSNQPVIRDPDLQTEALGGFNPSTIPPGGTTPGIDNTFYHGQLELVTRVSIVHSIWFDTGYGNPTYLPTVIEPTADLQPAGTQVLLSFRGASAIQGGDSMGNPRDDISTNAANLDFYGDPDSNATGPIGTPVPVITDTTIDPWQSSISQVNGAKLFQVRITFISNPISNKTAELSALGFSFRGQ